MKALRQTIEFDASPDYPFKAHADSKSHSATTNSKANVSRKAEAGFTAFDGRFSGHNLVFFPGRLIAQTWRAAHGKKPDLDSILVLKFLKTSRGG